MNIPALHFAFYRVPKCGSQSAFRAITVGLGDWKYKGGWSGIGPDHKAGAIIRHPFERLLSGYSNRILRDRLTIEPMAGVYAGMPLDEFVDAICALPNSALDRHFVPQVYYIKGPARLLRMETLDEDWQGFREWVSDRITLADLPHRNQSRRAGELDSKMKQKLRKRYQVDFDRLNYGTE